MNRRLVIVNLFGGQGCDTEPLILVGLVLVTLALAFGVAGDVKLGPTSLGTALVLASSADRIAMGNVCGSNAFNATIPFFSDLFSPAPLLGRLEGAHFAAGLAALVLMSMGCLVWKGVQRPAFARARVLAPAIPVVYLGGLYIVHRPART